MGKVKKKKTLQATISWSGSSTGDELWLRWRRNAENFDPLVPTLVGNQSRGGAAPHAPRGWVGGEGEGAGGTFVKGRKSNGAQI